jgi:hypothetical protein
VVVAHNDLGVRTQPFHLLTCTSTGVVPDTGHASGRAARSAHTAGARGGMTRMGAVASGVTDAPAVPVLPLSPVHAPPPVTPPPTAPQLATGTAGPSAGGTGQGKNVDGKAAILVAGLPLVAPEAEGHSSLGVDGVPVMRLHDPLPRPG